MIVSEIEVYHSRPIAPTRRVALGRCELPTDPAPGLGGVLLGGIAARFVGDLDPDLLPELFALTDQVEAGMRIPQPRLRHRLQQDRVGLIRSRHRLHRNDDDRLHLEFEEGKGAPAQHVLAAVYAAGQVRSAARASVMSTLRRGLRWSGDIGPALIRHLGAASGDASWAVPVSTDPVLWALEVLGLPGGGNGNRPSQQIVQRRFRAALRDAHPDHGGESREAADRIRDLTEARRILLP